MRPACLLGSAFPSAAPVQEGQTLLHVVAACMDPDPFVMYDFLHIASELLDHGCVLTALDKV
jgi:hypothetical protein